MTSNIIRLCGRIRPSFVVVGQCGIPIARITIYPARFPTKHINYDLVIEMFNEQYFYIANECRLIRAIYHVGAYSFTGACHTAKIAQQIGTVSHLTILSVEHIRRLGGYLV